MNALLLGIIIITGVVSVMAFQDKGLFYRFLFDPYQIIHRKQYYRMFSHGLLHADWMHLIVNMFVLYSFGQNLMYYFSVYLHVPVNILFPAFYILALPVSSIASLRKHKDNIHYNAVGASGAVSAVVFGSIFFDPWNLLYFFGVIPIPGILFGVGYLIYSYRMSKRGMDNIGHDAHFWGALFGVSFPLLLNPGTISVFIQQLLNGPSF